ncbi:putative component of type IV pili like system [Halorhabdus sp. SVX81]|uniref:hypothetical protein n=1 Tax=Halorhabdus sp. SVX81 TaxID=2978283 RepID=UPI0023DCA1E3|nr:hypothetical protein [Halorhabdus sp. SVX81]WEL18340.1 putative component of type IV pili like system [Halorhabdus sp. SVX81]
MNRTASIVTIALLVVGAAVAVPMAVAAGSAADGAEANSDSNELRDTNGTNVSANGSVAPGERLSAVVSAQEAEIEGDVDVRAFGIRLAQNASNASQSAVVADQLEAVRDRLQNLETERAQLQDARENGSMSRGEYAARASEMATQAQNAREMLNRTEAAADRLPVDRLEANGVNASAIQTLKTEASELTGSEVSRIARGIAGSDMAEQMRGGPGDRGPGDRGPADNETELPDDGADDRQPNTSGNETATDGSESGDY